jgi:signal transduction histidine kinase/ActR/RegA family two-component response regulator
MSEVDCRAASPVLAAVADVGMPIDGLVDGLGFGLDDLALPSRRLRWDDYTVFLERASIALGGPDALSRIGSEHSEHPAASVVRAIASAFVSVGVVYTIGAKWWGPRFFSCTRGEQFELDDGRARQVVTILPGYRDSEAFFHLIRGVLVSTPRVLGLREAGVTMRVEPHRAEYDIVVPHPQVPWWRRASTRFRRHRAIATTLAELEIERLQLGEALGDAENAHRALLAKTRRLELLNDVSQRLVHRTDVPGVVEAVLSLCDEGRLVEGLALELHPLDDEFPGLSQSCGRMLGAPDRLMTLRSATRELGELRVWCEASPALLDDLEPTIGLAIESALRFESLAAKSRRLESEMSERIRAERGLHQAQRMEVVGQLAGGLAHDFNNALMAMSGHAELALAESQVPEALRARVSGIVQEIDRSSRLIRQVLDFGRPVSAAPGRVDVAQSIAALQELLQQLAGESVQLEVFVGQEPAAVMLDDGQLEQILVNLVTNARDAMAHGGRITLRVSGGEDTVRIEVSDTGAGIAPELQPRVFEPFVTTKPRGTGLGLATVQGVVRGADGSIELESEVGKGTTFSIRLPAAGELAEPEASRPEGVELAGDGTTVLLVEDSAGVRTVVRALLESGHYQVLDAANVEAASELCRTHPGPIELLITDVALPDGDGVDLADRLKRIRSELRAVLFVSGYPDARLADEGSLPAAHALLRKPFTFAQLHESLASILAEADESARA